MSNSNEKDDVVDEFEKLIEDQFKLFDETSRKIIGNVVKFHEKTCGSIAPDCEENFVKGFMHFFSEKIEEKRKEVNDRRDQRNYFHLN